MAADPLPPSAMARPGTLNLNNEVVKMRKEVKRVRVLVIRKLVRSVGRLKSKKGTEDALLKNQRRAQRLLEEIHAMKELKPDIITKSALDDDINFEKTCKKPDSTATERAIARLAVHPLLKKKIDVLKAAVQAFKDARHHAPEAESSKDTSEESQCKDTLGSTDDAGQLQHRERTVVSEQRGKDAKTVAKKAVSDSKEKMAKREDGPKAVATPCSPGTPSGKGAVVTSAPQKAPADSNQKVSTKSTPRESEGAPGGNSDSERELSEEDKEYFDDSTEERFYKQSSVSEDSDSGDDFFIGKVKRTRKKDCSVRSSAKDQRPLPKMSPKTHTLETNWGVQNDQHKLMPEARKLESVFFHSLSGPKSSRRDSREQAPKNKAPDFPEDEPPIRSQFTKSAGRRFESRKQQEPAPLHPSWEGEPPIRSQFTKSAGRRFESRKQQEPAPLHPSWEGEPPIKSQFTKSAGRRFESRKQQEPAPLHPSWEGEPPIRSQFTKSAGRRFESRKQQEPAPLHPSWEASRRRKEQQSKITVFQGKKITFDD